MLDQRTVPVATKKFQLTELTALHYEILRRLSIGEKPINIAVDLDISPQTVSNVKRTVLARAKMSALVTLRDKEYMKANKRMADLLPKAVDIVKLLVDSGTSIARENPELALKIATNAMKLAGFSPTAEKQGGPKHLHLHNHKGATAEDLAEVRKSVQQAQSDGVIEEATTGFAFNEDDVVDITPAEAAQDAVRKLLEQDDFIVEENGVLRQTDYVGGSPEPTELLDLSIDISTLSSEAKI